MKKSFLLLTVIFSSISLYAQTSCGFEGTWKTNFDGVWCQMNMSMIGSKSMNGSYTYDMNGRTVYGKVKGTITNVESDGSDARVTMEGTWDQGSSSGKFEFTRVCSKPAFAGNWSNDNGQESGDWYGSKE